MSVGEMTKLDWAKHSLANNRVRKLGLLFLDTLAIFSAICLALLLYHQGQVAF